MVPPIATDTQATMDTQFTNLSVGLTIDGVAARRSKAKLMSWGIAAHASSDMFKGPGHGKPKSKRWDYRLNEESRSRKPGSLKGAAQYLRNEGIVNLGGGLPSSQYFPIEYIDVKVPKAPYFSEDETKAQGVLKRIGKYDLAEGRSNYDLHVALNYGQATGSAQLLRFITEHTEIIHNPPYQDWQCCMSVGNTSSLDTACSMFIARGECIITEEYTFSSAAETVRPMGVECVGVKMDEQGLLATSLDSILSNWDPSVHNNAPKPWLLYTVPSGQNPTGATQSQKRREEIYQVARKHDLYILEDEPYFFLQMQPYTGPNAPDVPPPASHEAFIKALVPSLLSMDVDGRVMRLDSFSKVIAPGLRVGWVTASEQIIERFIRHAEVSTQNPNGPSQLILYKLLEEEWGHRGYMDWLIHLRLEYTRRRDNICYACEEYLPKEIASWTAPMAGMFHWIKIDWQRHPWKGSKSMLEIEDEIFHAAIKRGALTSKGSWFRAESNDPGNDMFFRTTFAAAPNEKVQEGIKRFAEALKAVFQLE